MIETIKYGKLNWHHILDPSDEDFQYLQDTFNFHPLDIEDCRSRTQRPKIDVYDNYYFYYFYNKPVSRMGFPLPAEFIRNVVIIAVPRLSRLPLQLNCLPLTACPELVEGLTAYHIYLLH